MHDKLWVRSIGRKAEFDVDYGAVIRDCGGNDSPDLADSKMEPG